ncbi:hypothetical protein CYY_005742 [Polysphondylium violaceum]|uniref:FNIP repeat-containing protein n=1 Tax=Polysphondylium violaceum TaxID=133409 RepID=A0A8J4PUK8_9MYCE|nr:hypothetical protein CYY_005742 [Polysphondylium violaceum]
MIQQTQLFFAIFRNRYLRQKIFYSFYDYCIIKNISQLDNQYDRLCLLIKHAVPVVYYIKNLDHYHVYQSHAQKHLVTHVIVSSHFYVHHYTRLLRHQQPSPVLFGLAITDRESDPLLSANEFELPATVKYYKYTLADTLTKHHIPHSVTSLFLGVLVEAGVIPSRVTTLVVNIAYSRHQEDNIKTEKMTFSVHSLPKSLTSFSYYDHMFRFNDLNLNDLPPTLMYLNVTTNRGTLTGAGYGSLKYLLYSSTKCWTIPDTITQLKIDVSRDSLDSAKLPPNLNYLEFFEQNVFNSDSNTPFLFPSSLKTLSITIGSQVPISNYNCPRGIINYKNTNYLNRNINTYIPPWAEKAHISISNETSHLPVIPPAVTHLKFISFYHRSIEFTKEIPIGYFPYNLVKLTFQYNNELEVGLIPASVTDLKLHFSMPIRENVIPTSVTKLCLVGKHMDVCPIVIPNSVTTLSFQRYIQLDQNLQIPDSVKTLKVTKINNNIFPYNLFNSTFKNVTKFCLDQGVMYEKSFDDAMPNFKNNFSNLKQIVMAFTSFKVTYHFFDQKIYKEYHYDKKRNLKFKNK